MALRSNRFAALMLCALPALGIGVRTPHSNFVATFFYACPGSEPAPRVRMTYAVASRPRPRAASSPVDIYVRGQAPNRRYQLVGEVDVLAGSGRTSIRELTDHASRGARRMGGDAIVDVWWEDA